MDVGPLANQAGPFTFPAAGAQSQQFTVRRTSAGGAGTVELLVVDGCGSWPTLVGAGPTGWPAQPPPPR